MLQNTIRKKISLYGILAGLAICTKQSIGATLAIIVVGYKILFVENKEQFKQYIKIAITRVIGILIPVAILFVYLVISGAMQDFINYAVLGISTFSNNIPYSSLLQSDKIEIKVLSILVPISIMLMAIILIITKVLKRENEKIQSILTILIYSFSIIIVMYPISDKIHFLIGSLISIVGLIYIVSVLGKIIYDKIKFNKKYKVYKILTLLIWVFMFAIIFTKSINKIYVYAKTEKNIEIAHFKNIEVSSNLKNRINEIDNYILEKEREGKKVYILDAEAAIYMMPLDKYNKDYDMFLKGNIGKDGEEGQIEKIKQRQENELFLIRKENLNTNWQTPLNVIKYVKENLENIEEISIYNVYQ